MGAAELELTGTLLDEGNTTLSELEDTARLEDVTTELLAIELGITMPPSDDEDTEATDETGGTDELLGGGITELEATSEELIRLLLAIGVGVGADVLLTPFLPLPQAAIEAVITVTRTDLTSMVLAENMYNPRVVVFNINDFSEPTLPG
jgi:hypothetical protein